MNFEVAMEMQRICTGEKRELTRGQIAEEVLDINNLTKGFKPETVEKCTDFYNEMIKNGEKKEYDVDMLMEETESIKEEFQQFLKSNKSDDMFVVLYDEVGDFFQMPPFEGLDNIEYGIHEVCVLSILEYFTWRTMTSHNHEIFRKEYRDSIADRTYEEVADKWIKVYDDLQRRYDKIDGDVKENNALRLKIAGCCVIALTAIRDQDEFALDMAQSGAEKRAREIIEAIDADMYKEGESTMNDNVVKLFNFVYGYVKDNK